MIKLVACIIATLVCEKLYAEPKYFYDEVLQEKIRKYQEAQDFICVHSASSEGVRCVYEYVRDEKNYDEICRIFEEDFRYAFGEDWKNELSLADYDPYEPDKYKGHQLWVRRLILASLGKFDRDDIAMGYYVGKFGREREVSVRLAECVEKRFRKAGCDVTLVYDNSIAAMILEGTWYGKRLW